MSLEKLQEKMSQALIDFEDENGLIAGCFIYVNKSMKQMEVFEFDGEKFIPCKNKQIEELIT